MVLAGATYAAFWPGPGSGHAVWLSLAVAQPLLGVPLLLVTRQSGRSGLMGGALVLSILMVLGGRWVAIGWLGVAASALLLVGDFGTGARSSRLLAVALALGYGAQIAWLGWIALLRLG